MRAFFREQFSQQTQAYWVDWFADVDAAFAPVNDLRQAADDPQVRHREMVVTDDRGWEHLGIPIKFAQEPGRIDTRLPTLGQDNIAIARELGYSDDDIRRLTEDGAFGD